ncbi:MAG: hypothetical protein RLY71_1712 [Pseudomonadota bacterium]|jgi:predicted ATPase
MLEFMHIQRFKTLLDNNFSFSNLNVFSGLNGMGKSSVIQTLLLLRQSHELNILSNKGLLLKGSYINLGVGKDILSAEAEISSLEFLLKWAGMPGQRFIFDYQQDSDLQPNTRPHEMAGLECQSLFNEKFQYLSADRIPPRSQHDISDFSLRQLNSIGNHGEYAVQYIAEYGSKTIINNRLQHLQADSDTTLSNLNAWMSDISPGVRIKASTHAQLNIAQLAFSFEQGKDLTAEFKPQNVGFGLSYVLPVVAALLRAKSGDLVIIENPESHLHPAGQSTIGKMCALAASAGVQLVIETHSDHLLNGIRVAIKKQLIPPEQVRIFYLERHRQYGEHASLVQRPNIDSDGRIDQWPVGFFDEWDRNLEQLL